MSPSQRSFGTRNRITYSFQSCLQSLNLKVMYVVDRSSRFNMYIQMVYRLRISKGGENKGFPIHHAVAVEFGQSLGVNRCSSPTPLSKPFIMIIVDCFNLNDFAAFRLVGVIWDHMLSFMASVRLSVHLLSRFDFACIYYYIVLKQSHITHSLWVRFFG